MQETKPHPTTIDEYIALYPREVQEILSAIRAVIKETIPQAEERISYGMPAFFLNGGVVWFGAYRRHIGMYPITAAVEALEGIETYRGTKSALHFPLNKPVPYALIREIALARLAENQKGSHSAEREA